MSQKNFDARLDLVPNDPGVYLMKNHTGNVIYVGKAIDLRRRLASYFAENPQGNIKVQAMISNIDSYEYLVVANELEALLLESNLIKRYQPFYNILLKDDHDYPYIKVSVQEEYPKIAKAYRIGPDKKAGAKYYGPYLNSDVNQAIKIIRKLFPLKAFHRIFNTDKNGGDDEISLRLSESDTAHGKLDAIAEAGQLSSASMTQGQPAMDPDEYRAIVDDVCKFLEGNYKPIEERMRAKMQAASAELDFEKAAVWRDRLEDLMRLQEKQVAVLTQDFNGDVIGLARNSIEVCVQKLEIRNGRIAGTSTYFLDAAANTDEEIISAFIVQYYGNASYIPRVILLPVDSRSKNTINSDELDPSAELEVELLEFLKEIAGHKVDLHFPQRGPKNDVMKMANRNAKQALHRRTLIAGSNEESIETAMDLLQEILAMPHLPYRIEAYDVSNMGVDDMVCGMAVFENGKAKRKGARTFYIKRQEGQDDYAALQEAVDRRLNHLGEASFGASPDLILLDGGVGHVNALKPVLAKHGVSDSIYLAGMIKDQRHRTRGLALPTGEVIELAESLKLLDNKNTYGTGNELGSMTDIFSSDISTSREEQLALLRLLSAIQNETHRVANRARETRGKKRHTRYKLEEIPGVGPARRKALMRGFNSIKEISQASVEEILERVPSFGEKVAENVYEHFHPSEEE